MPYDIKYLSLQKTELEYEVVVRGGTPGESVSELRKQIAKIAPGFPPEDILESYLEASKDVKAVKETLLKTQANIVTLTNKFDKIFFLRTENTLHHVYHRLNRITPKANSLETYKVCSANFKYQYNELLAMKPQTAQGNSNDPKPITVNCERNLVSELSKIKFSGKTCVRSFIQRMDEFMQTRGVSSDKIITYAYEFFTDDALHWYRYIKTKITSWEELVVLLKQDFSQSDYDYKLMTEIRSRTQGENENITIYLSVMHGMFSRLNKPPPENEQLEILLHNIRPCYASTIAASSAVDTLENLKSVCRNYENIQSRLKQFHEPPKVNSETMAPDFAYDKSSTSGSSSYGHGSRKPNYSNTYPINYTKYNYNKPNYYSNNNNYKQSKPNTNYTNYKTYNNTNYTYKNQQTEQNKNIPVAVVNSENKSVFCPRCRTNNHSLKECREPHFPICFKCGKNVFVFRNVKIANLRKLIKKTRCFGLP